MTNVTGNKDSCSIEFWRQRLATFRIDPSQLSYANKGKVVASGGYGCVRKATLLHSTQARRTDGHPERHGWPTITSETVVAVKSLQFHGDIDLERFEKRFIREAYIWSELEHPNILEFLGFHFSHSDGEVEALLVCPWFDNGQSIGYLKRHGLSPMGRLRLILDAAEGLHYLHSRDPPICHGDVKGSNLFIKDNGRGALCDFGSAHELDEMFQDIASKTTQRCTVRWASPERLDSNDPPTPSSDVWSWGWLTWEIRTEKVPFPLLTNVSAVIFHIITSKLPNCEKEAEFTEFPHLSKLIQQCWRSPPDSRPSICDAIMGLKRILEPNESKSETAQAGRVPLPGPSLGNHTQGHPQFRLGENTKSILERLSPRSQRSIRATSTRNPITPIPELDYKTPKYPPNRENGSPTPAPGVLSPQVLSPTASSFLPTGDPPEALFRFQSPDIPVFAIALGKPIHEHSKTRASASHLLGDDATREPSDSPDVSSHRDPGPSRVVANEAPEASAGTSGSSSFRLRKRPFEPVEANPEVSPTHPSKFRRRERFTIPDSDAGSIRHELSDQDVSSFVNGGGYRYPCSIASSVPSGNPALPVILDEITRPSQMQKSVSPVLWPIGDLPGTDLVESDYCLGIDELTDPVSEGSQEYPATSDRNSRHRIPGPSPIELGLELQFGPGTAYTGLCVGDERIPSTTRSLPNRRRPPEARGCGTEKERLLLRLQRPSSRHDLDTANVQVRRKKRAPRYLKDDANLRWFEPAEISLFNNSRDSKGATHRGIIRATGQLVAVKSSFFGAINTDEVLSARLEHARGLEIRSSLNHPRIAEVLGGMFDGRISSDISAWEANGNIADFLKVAPHLYQIAEGLSYIHNHAYPIIHSNLKPSNILIDSEGNVKLGDAGIWQFVNPTAEQSQVQGKLEDIRWTAPEILEGQPPCKASDVYAFGCVALLILKDWLPYASLQSGVAVAKAIALGETPVDEGQASELHELWRACLARDSAARPQIQKVQSSVESW